MDRQRFHISLPVRQLQQLKALACKTGLSISELIRLAIAKYLRRQPDEC